MEKKDRRKKGERSTLQISRVSMIPVLLSIIPFNLQHVVAISVPESVFVCSFVLPSSVENGGGQGETGQGRDSKSYTGIGSLTVHPESTTVSTANADESSTELTDSCADGFNNIRSDGGEEEKEHGDGDGERKESRMTILPLSCAVPIRFSTITNPTFPSQLLSSFLFLSSHESLSNECSFSFCDHCESVLVGFVVPLFFSRLF